MRICTPEHPLKIVVLLSGNGSNLQAIIDAASKDDLPVDIAAVVSDKKEAYGLERARHAEIPIEVLPTHSGTRRGVYDQTLIETLDQYRPDLVVLAGFMRILSPKFVEKFRHRIVNIHPSLLPKYAGLNTHERALKAGDEKHGATVHVVTEDLDQGPIIMRSEVSIAEEDDVNSLKNKVHALEHKLYPEVIRLYALGRLEFTEDAVYLDGEPLPPEGLDFRIHY